MRSKLGDRRTDYQSSDQSADMGRVINARKHSEEQIEASEEEQTHKGALNRCPRQREFAKVERCYERTG